MPHKATGPACLTVLTARGRRLTKLVTDAGILPYDDAALFSVAALKLDHVEDFADLLRYLAPKASTCIVRAALKVPTHPDSEIRCKIRDEPGQPARFEERPRNWLMVDVEPPACPVDPTDPELVGGWLRYCLPKPFRPARAVVQLSSGAGIKAGARAHLWFRTDRPLIRSELEQLLGDAPGIDLSTVRPRQLHYVADPLFTDGIDDPCIWGRIAVLPGLAEVEVPELAPRPARHAFAPAAAHAYVAPPRGLGFKATRPEQYMLACLRALAAMPAGERHPAIVRISVRLFGLAQGGALDPVVVTGRIRCIAEPWGDLSEVDRILSWSWTHATPWRLPS